VGYCQELACCGAMNDITFSRPNSTRRAAQPVGGRRPEDGTERDTLEMLLRQARTASHGDEALEYVQRAVDMLPDKPRVRATAQLRVFENLNSDAFLAFLIETEKEHVIKFRNSRAFSAPKTRGPQGLYPPPIRREGACALSQRELRGFIQLNHLIGRTIIIYKSRRPVLTSVNSYAILRLVQYRFDWIK
jgi:hypothetical protein